MFLLAGGLFHLASGLFIGLLEFEIKRFRLLLQLSLGLFASASGLFQIVLQLCVRLDGGQFGIRDLATGLKDLGLGRFGNLEQFFVMFLHHGGALGFAGSAELVQFLGQLADAIGPGGLARLKLAFDFGFVQVTQGILLNDCASK